MQIKFTDSFKKLCELVINKQCIFALYSLPKENEIILILQKSNYLSTFLNFNENKGFVIIPFDLKKEKYIINPDILITNKDNVNKCIIEKIKNCPDRTPYKKTSTKIKCITKEEFIKKVNIIKNSIKENKVKKVVLSRVEYYKIQNNFSLFDFFIELKKNYPHAFIFLFSIDKDNLWIGASPEPFLIIEDEKATIYSIAGTQNISSSNIKNISWSEKDIFEQSIVSEYFENILVNEFKFKIQKTGPETYNAGNVAHLKTTFHINNNFFNKINDIIYKLHPSPSISGYPKDKAIEIINQLEEYDRDLYSGIIGPINLKNQTNLYVNLRCMKKNDNEIWAFQGAGIVHESIPEKEWEETENKKMTLISILSKIIKNEQ